jgi:hypothetical protein
VRGWRSGPAQVGFPGGGGEGNKKKKKRGRRGPGGPGRMGQRGHAAHARGARDALVVSLLATMLARGERKEKAGSGQGLNDGRSGRRRSSGGWWRVEAVQRRARWASSSSAALSRDTVFLAAPYSRSATAVGAAPRLHLSSSISQHSEELYRHAYAKDEEDSFAVRLPWQPQLLHFLTFSLTNQTKYNALNRQHIRTEATTPMHSHHYRATGH